MPDTFFIGDHMNMFPHMLEKVMVQTEEGEAFSDNCIVLNGIKLQVVAQLPLAAGLLLVLGATPAEPGLPAPPELDLGLVQQSGDLEEGVRPHLAQWAPGS